jgi:Diacylglycerol kinase catalytic domain
VVSTERGNHARGALEALPAEELARFDGVVAVGGDGLFQETLNALLTLRCVPLSRWKMQTDGAISWGRPVQKGPNVLLTMRCTPLSTANRVNACAWLVEMTAGQRARASSVTKGAQPMLRSRLGCRKDRTMSSSTCA